MDGTGSRSNAIKSSRDADLFPSFWLRQEEAGRSVIEPITSLQCLHEQPTLQAVTHLAGATEAIDLHARSGGHREQKKKEAEERPSCPGRKAGSTTPHYTPRFVKPSCSGHSHHTGDDASHTRCSFSCPLVSDQETARLHTNSHVVECYGMTVHRRVVTPPTVIPGLYTLFPRGSSTPRKPPSKSRSDVKFLRNR